MPFILMIILVVTPVAVPLTVDLFDDPPAQTQTMDTTNVAQQAK